MQVEVRMDYHENMPAGAAGKILVTLDGETVNLPAGRRSLNSIRCFLEAQSLEKQRVLSALVVDGHPANLALPLMDEAGFCRVDAESIALDELPLLLLTTAQQQVDRARESVETAVTLVLINSHAAARELWWNLARQLKEPVLTLSLMPGNVCQLCGNVSFDRLRKWQLEQIAAIVREVDGACDFMDSLKISDALENRVLPWLQKLDELIRLWLSAVSSGYQLGIKYSAV
jgi:hypothetical protein